ncbi:ribonuclease H-like domain-containing protein [Tanacetum coccineum]
MLSNSFMYHVYTQLLLVYDAIWAVVALFLFGQTSGWNIGVLGDNLLSWYAKRQVTLSRSSAEAEYQGVANVVAETAWIRNLLCELHTPLFTATLVYSCELYGVQQVYFDIVS